jgi:cytochrome c
VKALMRSAVGKAKAAGQDTTCTSCHVDMKSYGLKPNAVTDLKKWL